MDKSLVYSDLTFPRASGVERGLGLQRQLHTVATAFPEPSAPGPGPAFPQLSHPTPNFLIVLLSGPLDSFGSVTSHLVSENPS